MLGFRIMILVFFIIGIIIITSELTKMSFKCPKQKIESKYMPRTLDLDLKESENIDNIFKNMFQDSEPWIGTSRADAARIRKIKMKELDKINNL